MKNSSNSILEAIKQIQGTNNTKFKPARINHATETPTGNSADNLTFISARDKGHFVLVGDKYK